MNTANWLFTVTVCACVWMARRFAIQV